MKISESTKFDMLNKMAYGPLLKYDPLRYFQLRVLVSSPALMLLRKLVQFHHGKIETWIDIVSLT